MSTYIIKHDDGGYLCKGTNGQWVRTSNLMQAERLDYNKALNILSNCISPAFRRYWKIAEEEQPCAVYTPMSKDETVSTDFDWDEISNAQFQLFNNLTRYGEELKHRLSEVDLEICDIQHYIEFFALDAAKGYKAYKMLKERLERRRYIKDEMLKVNCFLGGSSADFSSGKVNRQIKGLDTRKYTPRVLCELFGMNTQENSFADAS